MAINFILVVALLLAALWTVMTARLIRSAFGLALTSAVLAILLFRLDSPMAAVFELSVCAGLIPVIFVTTISLTHRLSQDAFQIRQKERWGKYWYLLVIVVLVGVLLSRRALLPDVPLPVVTHPTDVRIVMWNMHHVDLLGQVAVILAGVFGVVILFKEVKK
ncbi:MAG TPA: hypothetical protein PL155_04660 [Candidatus Omnitrophota bacterium]|nr:hypothetical protein [Candidatus Omnitrophota bacterium]HPD84231.1 hypothetical protein [Candidatus Omnitrophota bacterium]HRZ03087.1 hypothetical protein [Candidatus Omnitrophota bacterium]